jgi:hypothetical protein
MREYGGGPPQAFSSEERAAGFFTARLSLNPGPQLARHITRQPLYDRVAASSRRIFVSLTTLHNTRQL